MRCNLSHLLIALFYIVNVGFIIIEPALAQDFTCPEETHYFSENPFTLQEVEDYLGFSHPTLQELTEIPVWELGLHEPYFFDMSCTPFHDTYYVGILFWSTENDLNAPQLKVDTFKIVSSSVVFSSTYDNVSVYGDFTFITQFADRNFNGLPDLFITGWHGGSSPGGNMQVLEIDESDQLIDITPKTDTNGPLRFDEINGDGIPEIYDHTWYSVPTFYTDELFYFMWLGLIDNTYEVVAVRVSSFADSFDAFNSMSTTNKDSGEHITRYLNSLTQDKVCEAIVQTSPYQYSSYTSQYGEEIRWKVFHILLYNYVWDDIATGWESIDTLMLMAESCPQSDGKAIFFETLVEYEIYFHTRWQS